MSYEPTEWKNGDVVTAQKLNNIEAGIKRLPLSECEIVHFIWDELGENQICDKTYTEIEAMLDNYEIVFAIDVDTRSLLRDPVKNTEGAIVFSEHRINNVLIVDTIAKLEIASNFFEINSENVVTSYSIYTTFTGTGW